MADMHGGIVAARVGERYMRLNGQGGVEGSLGDDGGLKLYSPHFEAPKPFNATTLLLARAPLAHGSYASVGGADLGSRGQTILWNWRTGREQPLFEVDVALVPDDLSYVASSRAAYTLFSRFVGMRVLLAGSVCWVGLCSRGGGGSRSYDSLGPVTPLLLLGSTTGRRHWKKKDCCSLRGWLPRDCGWLWPCGRLGGQASTHVSLSLSLSLSL